MHSSLPKPDPSHRNKDKDPSPATRLFIVDGRDRTVNADRAARPPPPTVKPIHARLAACVLVAATDRRSAMLWLCGAK